MVMGSSGLPAPVISCMSALPMEVARSETCMSLHSMSGCCGTVVTWPSQEPARVFSLSKDFCASECAKATTESDSRTTTDSIRLRDFIIYHSLLIFEGVAWISAGVIVDYNTMPLQGFFPISLCQQRSDRARWSTEKPGYRVCESCKCAKLTASRLLNFRRFELRAQQVND